MILFWLILTLMILISLSFVLWPLLRKPHYSGNIEPQTKETILQQQLQELASDFKTGMLDPQAYENARHELASGFLADQKQNTHREASKEAIHTTKQRSWLTVLFLMIFIPLFTITFYLKWGDSAQVAQWFAIQRNATKIQNVMAGVKSYEQLIAKIQETLKRNPNSSKGWFLLGHLYFSMKDYEKASRAFAKANALKPDDISIMTQYADALFLANDKKLSNKGNALVQQILKKQPGSPGALNLLALNAYRQKAYKQAIHYWERLLPMAQPNSEERALLMKALANAQSALKRN